MHQVRSQAREEVPTRTDPPDHPGPNDRAGCSPDRFASGFPQGLPPRESSFPRLRRRPLALASPRPCEMQPFNRGGVREALADQAIAPPPASVSDAPRLGASEMRRRLTANPPAWPRISSATPRDSCLCGVVRGLPASRGDSDLNERPPGPQPARSGRRCVPERPPRPIVHARGHSGRIGRISRYQSGTTTSRVRIVSAAPRWAPSHPPWAAQALAFGAWYATAAWSVAPYPF